MTTYVFHGAKRSASHKFTCPKCGKKNRTRKFTVEHTVNPFNKNEDGSVKTYAEVSRDSKADAVKRRDEFATEPLCKACEDALSYTETCALNERRRQSPRPEAMTVRDVVGAVNLREARDAA